MSSKWIAVIGTVIAVYALKLIGATVPERIVSHPRFLRITQLIPAALLSALVATQTFANKTHLVIDHRIAGVGVAFLALIAKAPLPVAIVIGALTSALVYRFA
jgi:branched-subunit amino acid transport protein